MEKIDGIDEKTIYIIVENVLTTFNKESPVKSSIRNQLIPFIFNNIPQKKIARSLDLAKSTISGIINPKSRIFEPSPIGGALNLKKKMMLLKLLLM